MRVDPDGCCPNADERQLATDENQRTMRAMAVWLIFFMGIGNFAMHKAVLESRHPMVSRMPLFTHALGRRIALGFEFTVLLAAMLLAGNGYPALVWGYLLYTGVNALAAWLILTNRI